MAFTVPLALGQKTLFLRDTFTTHLHFKAFGAEQLRSGKIPAFNPTWGLGQPFRGNPNALALYPGNLLYLVLPFWSAFNLHYTLHWLLAFLTMSALARELGQGREGSLLAGLTYAGCGWMLSALTFYNILTVAAWWPLVLLGGRRTGRQGLAIGGLACGMALLGGEPITAALGLVPLLLVAVQARGWVRGFTRVMALGMLGLAVALPQVVATLRALPFTYRGSHGMIESQATAFSLHPARFLELLLPLPFGWPGHLGRYGRWALEIQPEVPYVLSLYGGLIGLWLAGLAIRKRKAWAALAATGLLLAWLGGLSGTLLLHLSFGLFRYPEKMLFWWALSLPLLAGWGLEAMKESSVRRRWPWAAALGALGVATCVAALGPFLARAVQAGTASTKPGLAEDAMAIVSTQSHIWALYIAGIAGLLVVGNLAMHRRMAMTLVLLQALSLSQLAPLVLTDGTGAYREAPEWVQFAGPSGSIFNSRTANPPWQEGPTYRTGEHGPRFALERIRAADLGAAPGVLHGLTYPLAPDLEGFHSPRLALLQFHMPLLDWPAKVRWLRAMGVELVVLFSDPDVEGLDLLDERVRAGVGTGLYRVQEPAPAAWWPKTVRVVASSAEAQAAVSRSPDPIQHVVLEEEVDHRSATSLDLVVDTPDRLEMEIEGQGGVAVVRRSYQPLFRATSGEEELRTLPVNLNLLGIVVPPGRHHVVVQVEAWPEILAAGFAGTTVLILAAVACLGRRRPVAIGSPA